MHESPTSRVRGGSNANRLLTCSHPNPPPQAKKKKKEIIKRVFFGFEPMKVTMEQPNRCTMALPQNMPTIIELKIKHTNTK